MESNLGSGMLGLDMPFHPQHTNSNLQHQQMVAFAPHETSRCVKQNTTKGKQPQPQLGLSDDDEQGYTADDFKQVSPWQRVKWTDTMVRLLIMVVYYIGDDVSPEANDPPGVNKKKPGAMLQKKGKWKSVSKAMMEKGFYVSPQQCEDKFNDLNKRYKRVTDVLGKGTACKVVENQSLLDTMDQLSPKMKEETRKLLNSKHLFFREMCAYHNSGFGGGAVGVHQSPEAAADSAHPHPLQQMQQQCFHSSDGALRASRMVRGGIHEEQDEDEENEDDDEDNDESEDSEDDGDIQDVGGSGKCPKEQSGRQHGDKISSPTLTSIQNLSCELMSILQDGTKSPVEQRQWMRNRSMQLEEQRVSYQCRAFELEKQRMNWSKFSWKKEREMERMKLNNDQTRLEIERMVLVLRQKELELRNLHRQ